MKSSLLIGLAMILCLFMTACSKESKLIGKWVGDTGSFEFSKDKTGLINPPQGTNLPTNVPFKWSMQGSDTVRMDVGAPVGRMYFGRLESSDTLIIEDGKFVKQK